MSGLPRRWRTQQNEARNSNELTIVMDFFFAWGLGVCACSVGFQGLLG